MVAKGASNSELDPPAAIHRQELELKLETLQSMMANRLDYNRKKIEYAKPAPRAW